MKKITLGLIFLLLMCLFVGCEKNADNKAVNTDNKAVNTDNKAVIAEIKQSLNQNDTQVLIAFGDNCKAKEGLIQSTELHSEGLIALCTNPEPMKLDYPIVQEWFKEAIKRTELTADQEVQIAKIDEACYKEGLLLRTNLTGSGLVTVCENPGSLILDATVQEWFKEAIERTELTADQEVQIAKIDKNCYKEGLLLRTNLTGSGLVAVCENPGSLNFDYNASLQDLFNEAIERTELTADQEVQIAKIDEDCYKEGLLLRTNLTGSGLVAVCENPGSLNLDYPTVQKLFKEAIERTELTSDQKAMIAKSKVKGLGLY